jgi:hypothetical protein
MITEADYMSELALSQINSISKITEIDGSGIGPKH